ncbi:NAD(P)/FAD-dependent oxidoreductase [Actinomadura flavalba]|uniref:NAD(P)/FAD-dependent oxidoreductase n=1 Tax=Actinomadura flavalba TaxID=1120938 RepID=UPI000378FFE1|nr:FAD-dependent oxidoreductase [Actinomadura flavalba]
MDADLIIVGAGIVGCLVAREALAREPGARIVVADQREIGGGATRYSAGLHFPRGSTARVRAMAAHSQEYYAKLKAADPGTPLQSLGMTIVAPAGHEAALHETYLPEARLTPASAAPVAVPAGHAAWTGTGCHYADVPSLTARIARELRDTVTFREGTAVEAVEPSADGAAVRLSTGETLSAPRVVVAVGPWLPSSPWNDAPRARVKKVVALHVDVPPLLGDPVIVFEAEDAFLLPFPHRGHWLLSYTSTDWDVTPGDLGGLAPADLAAGRDLLARYAPAMADRCRSGRVFCDAYSADRTPLVRPLAADARVVVAGAANGSGYRLAPAIAAETLDLLDRLPASPEGQHT